MAYSAGTRLGPYEIVALIGAGGMGEVYRARDPKLKREVALKVLPEIFADDPERMARFQREAEVLASLNHPNIAHIYGVEDRALVMELVEGESPKGPLPLEDARKIGSQIAEALEYAHEKGVIHRDLKPANVKVTPEGVVKLLDFGLAKAIEDPIRASEDPSASPTLTLGATRVGMIMGTAAYMGPEQASGKPADRRADIWSFGAVLYELLAGKKAFDGDSVSDTLASVLKLEPDWSALPAATPPSIKTLIRRCLTKDRKQRLQAIGEARIVLENPAIEEPVAPQSKAPRHSWLAWGFAALFLGMAALLAFIHFREASPSVAKLFIPPPENGNFPPNFPTIAVSPDGQRVAFEAVVNGNRGLWVRDLDNPTPRLLAPFAGNFCIPFWAPDSRRLGFFEGTKLKTIDVRGGPATTITDDGAVAPGSGSWNQHDVIIYGRLGGALFRVPATGGTPAPLTQLDRPRRENAHRAPWFLPDGRHFLYVASSGVSEENSVYVGDLASKTPKRLGTFGAGAIYVNPGYLLFIRQRTLLAQPFDTTRLETTGDAVVVAEQVDTFTGGGGVIGHYSASQNGVLVYETGGAPEQVQLTWYDRAGNKLGTVGSPGEWREFSLSPDGERLVFDRRDQGAGRFDVWTYDLARGSELRLTTSGTNISPLWSPDGMDIYFHSNRDGAFKVYRKSNNTGPEEVVEADNQAPQDVSRDGRYLLTETGETNPRTGSDIWVFPLFGKGKPFAYVQTEFAEVRPRVSPDGRWLAYQSDESRNQEIYIESFPRKGQKWQASTGGGRSPVWSRDGRELYYYSPDDYLVAVDVKPSVSGTVRSPLGVARKLFHAHLSTNAGPHFDVSKDGRFLLPVPVGQPAASALVTVVLNWPELLKKK